jgi:superfamily II DNA/RNA helicase
VGIPHHPCLLQSRLADPGDSTIVVSNARVLSEGVDVPELDGVMFADPRNSPTDVVQAVGRALRRGGREDKTATIIVPILLNQAESPEAALDGSQFDTVYRVVRALRAHDERLADELDERRIAVTTEDLHEGDPREHRLPDWFEVIGTPVTAAFAAALSVRTVRMTTSPWADGLAAARAYRDAHGHLNPETGHVTGDGFPLGAWLASQRARSGEKIGTTTRSRNRAPAVADAAAEDIHRPPGSSRRMAGYRRSCRGESVAANRHTRLWQLTCHFSGFVASLFPQSR